MPNNPPLELSPAIAAYAAKLRGLDLPPAGGRIRGPGTARSDSVPARIAETGEPIKVSNRERVVSAEQDTLLNAIAQGAGYKSLDAMFKDFGMPAGPVIKGSKRHAADGMAPEPDEPKPITSPASQNQPQEGRIQAAIAAPPTLSAGASYGRSEPVGKLSGPAAGLTETSPAKGSLSLSPRFGPGRDASGVITADSAKTAYGNDMQRSGGVFGTTDMAGVNGILERENKARGEMIDLSIKANGGNGIAILGGDGPTEAEKINAERTQRWMLDDLAKDKSRSGKAAYGQAVAQIIAGNNQQTVEQLRQQGVAAGHNVQMRGQDIGNAAEMARLGLTARGQDLNAKHQAQAGELAAIRTGLDVERFGLDKQAAQRQQVASDALIKATASGDPAAIAQARQAASSAGLKVEPAPNLQHVETDRGQMAFNPQTGKMTPVTAPDGTPIGGAKALTEFQGKSTSYGMRAQEASEIIDQVGQGGKVQPSLLKRGAESIPLIGEGLGMVANQFATPAQQEVEQAQRSFVSAVLRQESGAAISDSEFRNAQRQYFPAPGDTPEVIAQKAANRAAAINGFRVSAGPGAKHIGGATPAKTEPAKEARQAQDPQQSGAPKVGTVDGKHVFIGGNPADPSSWAEVR